MAIYALDDVEPQIDDTAFVHPDATVIGRVTLGAGSSVWPQAVLRGDYGAITVGERTSIQDGSVIHATRERPTLIGSDCVIGHNVHLEGCTIHNRVLVGSGAVCLHNVVVHPGAVVAAGAVLLDGTLVPAQAMALGVPAKVREGAVTRDLVSSGVELYVANGRRYKTSMRRLD